jgi:hypothetical protein
VDIFHTDRERHTGPIEPLVELFLILVQDVVVYPRGIVLRWIGGSGNTVFEAIVIHFADIHQPARGAFERRWKYNVGTHGADFVTV